MAVPPPLSNMVLGTPRLSDRASRFLAMRPRDCISPDLEDVGSYERCLDTQILDGILSIEKRRFSGPAPQAGYVTNHGQLGNTGW
jgi:hypothetical protein